MKRTIITVLLVLSLTFLIALESDPSETVGFVKITAGMGYTPFALPFTFYDATHTETHLVSDIIGDQVTGGTPTTSDRIIDVNTGQFAFYNSGTGTFAGTLANITPGHVYYVQVKNTAFNWIFNPAPPRESLFKQTKKTKVLKN
ncbi:MAG: hypothetical protein K8S23_04970 [Candidatus Cloacimonetes bacterium]|nr:hypothetical protein [Candidatus Cloacimonadota bacterium]